MLDPLPEGSRCTCVEGPSLPSAPGRGGAYSRGGQGLILRQLPFGLTVPIDGHGPGHFECPVRHPLTLLGRAPWRGRKDSGEGGRRTVPLLSLCISGWWRAVFPSCSISMWKGRAGSTGEPCLSVCLPENPPRGFCLCLSSQAPPPL